MFSRETKKILEKSVFCFVWWGAAVLQKQGCKFLCPNTTELLRFQMYPAKPAGKIELTKDSTVQQRADIGRVFICEAYCNRIAHQPF
jgi:hypothetical protein